MNNNTKQNCIIIMKNNTRKRKLPSQFTRIKMTNVNETLSAKLFFLTAHVLIKLFNYLTRNQMIININSSNNNYLGVYSLIKLFNLLNKQRRPCPS